MFDFHDMNCVFKQFKINFVFYVLYIVLPKLSVFFPSVTSLSIYPKYSWSMQVLINKWTCFK